ncbi:hypothetical protein LTR36_008969 [Oleoguttula mirabilis]|uniref:Uncharacterized protein n=1 Tax=Oleoguttula mirabilis TaxID=1507867 RepID=A0AAV9J6Y2_9PEZI|nr:hypothetical protein LTR36_008969 [Oleoguttula mirabilis]
MAENKKRPRMSLPQYGLGFCLLDLEAGKPSRMCSTKRKARRRPRPCSNSEAAPEASIIDGSTLAVVAIWGDTQVPAATANIDMPTTTQEVRPADSPRSKAVSGASIGAGGTLTVAVGSGNRQTSAKATGSTISRTNAAQRPALPPSPTVRRLERASIQSTSTPKRIVTLEKLPSPVPAERLSLPSYPAVIAQQSASVAPASSTKATIVSEKQPSPLTKISATAASASRPAAGIPGPAGVGHASVVPTSSLSIISGAANRTFAGTAQLVSRFPGSIKFAAPPSLSQRPAQAHGASVLRASSPAAANVTEIHGSGMEGVQQEPPQTEDHEMEEAESQMLLPNVTASVSQVNGGFNTFSKHARSGEKDVAVTPMDSDTVSIVRRKKSIRRRVQPFPAPGGRIQESLDYSSGTPDSDVIADPSQMHKRLKPIKEARKVGSQRPVSPLLDPKLDTQAKLAIAARLIKNCSTYFDAVVTPVANGELSVVNETFHLVLFDMEDAIGFFNLAMRQPDRAWKGEGDPTMYRNWCDGKLDHIIKQLQVLAQPLPEWQKGPLKNVREKATALRKQIVFWWMQWK